jgi:hypothetical protein
MPHDERDSDLWYHDVTMPGAIIGNWIYYLKETKKDLSHDEVIMILNKIEKQNNAIRAILYEVYLEKRRLENKEGG